MTPTDFDSFVQALSGALKVHDWRIVAGLGCIALTWLARLGLGKIPGKAGAFFSGDAGGALTALLVGIAGSFGRALFASKDPISAQFVIDGLVVGVTSAGGFSVVKKLFAGNVAKVAGAASIAVLLALPGCAWLQAHPGVNGALNCGENAIVSAIPSVLANVVAALAGGSPDWASLGQLELKNTPDLIKCAAQSLVDPPKAAGVKSNPNVARNARAYLAGRADGGV